jgi:hypothetical protein
MTPEEHIARAEWLISPQCTDQDPEKAYVHVRIAEFKKKYPPESGRPLPSLTARRQGDYIEVPVEGTDPYPALAPDHPLNKGSVLRESGRMHNHVNRGFCHDTCPAHGTTSTNHPRPISDNPQA